MRFKWDRFGGQHYQYLHQQFTQQADRLLRFEDLGGRFARWMRDEGVSESLSLRRENTTQRKRDYRDYYDRDSRALVERIFRPYLERFDYQF